MEIPNICAVNDPVVWVVVGAYCRTSNSKAELTICSIRLGATSVMKYSAHNAARVDGYKWLRIIWPGISAKSREI